MIPETEVTEKMKTLTHIPADLFAGGMVTAFSFPPTASELSSISADLFESTSLHHHFEGSQDFVVAQEPVD